MGRVYNALVRSTARQERTAAAGQPRLVLPGTARRTPSVSTRRFRDAAEWIPGPQGSPRAQAATQPHPLQDAASSLSPPVAVGHANADQASAESLSATSAAAKAAPPAVSHIIAPQPPPIDWPRLPVAGLQSARVDPRLASIVGKDCLARERYQTLAVRVLNFAAARGIKSILVTSASQAEGKTTVALSLAIVLARARDKKVLLLDAALRNPCVGARLALPPGLGYSEALEGRPAGDCVVKVEPGGLAVMTSGSLSAGKDPDVAASSRPGALIRELERSFDLILIDSGPVVESADAQRMASVAGGSVLVVRAGRTHYRLVDMALKFIPKDRRIGVVLNEAESGRP